MLSLPFEQNTQVLEIGGGRNPYFRPNLDVRPEPEVDIVADINEKLPIESDTVGGVFCRYAIEHISWRQIRDFIAEVYRILEPGKTAYFVTANLLEQARLLTEIDDFEDKWVCMVFGDNDYPENCHRCGFSPEFAGRLFQEAGFESVLIMRHPDWRGDMVIEAVKPEAQHIDLDKPEELFDKNYFDGGKKVGGYAFEGYRDFPVHWVTAQKILDLEPKSVLEIGCARGYIIKKLEDKGIPCKGLEVSKHCYLTRASDNVINWNVCQTPWPFADKEFDVCFSVAVMEHIPEKHLANVLKEIDRVSQRGIHGIDFGENDDGFDQTHCTLHPLKWWMERFGHNQIVVDKEFMEEHEGSIASYVPTGDNKLKLNIGSHIIMFHNGWVNMDVLNLSQFAIREGYKFLQHDSRTKLPFGDETVDLIYSSHFLEHLTYDDAVVFMTECKRVMKKGATMRLMLPDTELLMSKCANHTMSDFDEINVESANANTDMAKFWNLVFNGHLAAYDFNSLRMLCEKVGLHCERKAFRQGHKQILSETLDTLPCLSLFAEVTKH